MVELENKRSTYVIDNATSIENIFQLIKEKSDEFWGIKFTKIKVSGLRVGKDRDGEPVAHFRLGMEADKLSDETKVYLGKFMKACGRSVFGSSGFDGVSINKLFCNWKDLGVVLRGLEFGSGSPGRWGGGALIMDARINIKEYPHILKKYALYENYLSEVGVWEAKEKNLRQLGNNFVRTTEEYMVQKEILDRIRVEFALKEKEQEAILNRGIDLFMKVNRSNMGSPPQYPEALSPSEFAFGDISIS
jgi:hypothetical protein